MSDTQPSDEQMQQYVQAFQAVAQRLAAGRTPSEVTEELIAAGMQTESAVRLVGHVQEEWQKYQQTQGAERSGGGRQINLQEHFPDLTPISSSPALFTLNGFGLSIYGNRDRDEETGAHVTTHCVCLLFIPVFALGAYRVVPAGGERYYFLGKEPLSTFAKCWNLLVLLLVAGGIGAGVWNSHVNTPEYQAGRKLEQAKTLADAGDLGAAARLLQEVSQSGTSHAPAAVTQFRELISRVDETDVSLEKAIPLFQCAVQIHESGRALPEAVEPALRIARKNKDSSPSEAMRLVAMAAVIQPEPAGAAAAEVAAADTSALTPPQLEEFFRTAGRLVRLPDGKQTAYDAGVKQVRRLATNDLKGATTLLAALSPLSDGPTIAKELDALLTERAAAMSAAELKELLALAWGAFPSEAKESLAKIGLDAVARQKEWKARDALSFLDVFANADDRSRPALDAERRRLLEKLVAEEPNDLDAATQLALVLERAGETERIIEVLEPHRLGLGDREATRLLGQALARVGKFDESYALLSPYVAIRLRFLHAAEKSYEIEAKRVQDRIFSQLETGAAPGFDFARAQRVEEEAQNQMVREYLSQQFKNDAALKAARETIIEHSRVVPVALDLGIVTLHRGQQLEDADARKAELEKAEQTFLAIQGAASEDDRYRLYLGQVYYWLGRHEEGRKLFDELLESQGRTHKLLLELGSILRDIGESRGARALLEEAYEKSATDEERHAAAHIRSITQTDLDDRISWLKKSDPADNSVKADLAHSEGSKAENAGNDEEAAKHFRRAAMIYDAMPESNATLNNGALSWIDLYEATGDRKALEQGAQRFERAAALAPSNAIVLGNQGDTLLRLAFAELAGPDISPHRLGLSSDFHSLHVFSTDLAAEDALRVRARNSTSLKRSIDVLEKASLLAPKRVELYAQLLSVHNFTRQEAALKRLAERVEAAGLDHTESTAQIVKAYRNPTEDGKARWRANVARARRLVTEFRDEKRKADFVLAVAQYINGQSQPYDENVEIDADELVRLAEEADAMLPSRKTKESLAQAHFFRACADLASRDATFGSSWKSARLVHDPATLIAAGSNRPAPLGPTVRSHPDVVRGMDLRQQLATEFPESQNTATWMLLRRTHPAEAAKVAEHLRQDETSRIIWKIWAHTSPVYPGTLVRQHWMHLIDGNPQEADAAIKRLYDSGIPVPEGLFERDDSEATP